MGTPKTVFDSSRMLFLLGAVRIGWGAILIAGSLRIERQFFGSRNCEFDALKQMNRVKIIIRKVT
jgi:uncharacterized membrane protein